MFEYTNWTPEVIRVKEILPHNNADSLEIIMYAPNMPVVVKKGEFKEGDLAFYFPIDTLLPDLPMFSFLGDKKIVGAKRLRGQYSQGLLLPVPEGITVQEGDSLLSFFDLKKVEDEEVFRLRKQYDAEVAPKFGMPEFGVLGSHRDWSWEACEELFVTEKLHGSFFAAVFTGGKLHLKSKNVWLRDTPECPWWSALKKLDLTIFERNDGVVFMGEMVGLQKGFPYGEGGNPRLFFFDMWDGVYSDYGLTHKRLIELGLPVVPEIKVEETLYKTAEGKSLVDPTHIREGIVFTPYGGGKARSRWKIISNAYNLRKFKKG